MPSTDEAPYLVSLGFDLSTFERLDRLRSRYFPPQLNQVPAHLMLFHHLPGDEGDAVDRALSGVARSAPALELSFPSLKRIGRGMMLPAEAPELLAVHASLARTFARWLTPQDREPYRPHVTLMNKADRAEVDAAFGELQSTYSSWSGLGDRLILWRYLGGPWEEVEKYPFRGDVASTVSEAPTSTPEG